MHACSVEIKLTLALMSIKKKRMTSLGKRTEEQEKHWRPIHHN